MSDTQRFFYESLTVISSVPEKSVRFREVAAIKNVRYKEVSLYLIRSGIITNFRGFKRIN